MGDKELEDMVDSIMKEDDFNGDGYQNSFQKLFLEKILQKFFSYIDYGEFLRAQKGRT